MLARLLYAAVGLCLLGTDPDRASTRSAPSVEAAAAAAAAPGIGAGRPTNDGGAPAPADFAIPRIQR